MLAADELIEEIAIPAPPAGTRQRYLKFRIRNAIDFPIVGVAFRATLEGGKFHDARVVLGAVAPIPLRAQRSRRCWKARRPARRWQMKPLSWRSLTRSRSPGIGLRSRS